MRIAIAGWSRRVVGGAETYIARAAAALAGLGHEVALWFEGEGPAGRPEIAVPAVVPVWSAGAMGTEPALRALRGWRPDAVYCNALLDTAVEALLPDIAPAVLVAHAYYGACISGHKSHSFPGVRPCGRTFGASCLLHYLPRRCGGLNPLAMWRAYRHAEGRRRLLLRYRTVVTFSAHMRDEMARYAPRVVALPPPVEPAAAAPAGIDLPADVRPDVAARLLSAGRLDRLKGGRVLLESLPAVAARLGRPVELTFAGDGPERPGLEARAAGLATASGGRVKIAFAGWVGRAEVSAMYRRHDLLVVPSLWPEPFGLIGPEAGSHGLPAAAFDVGGIRDWLTDGLNGRLAPGNPATAAGLAEAIVGCLSDPAVHAAMRRAAADLSRRFLPRLHAEALAEVLREAAGVAETAAAGAG
jgi:glycosyltransferase involved in cell wall biosynthesis